MARKEEKNMKDFMRTDGGRIATTVVMVVYQCMWCCILVTAQLNV